MEGLGKHLSGTAPRGSPINSFTLYSTRRCLGYDHHSRFVGDETEALSFDHLPKVTQLVGHRTRAPTPGV